MAEDAKLFELDAYSGGWTTKAGRRVHANSAQSHDEDVRSGRITSRSRAILIEIRRRGPGTGRQLAKRLNAVDHMVVQPRISELVDAGFLRELGSVICEYTKKRVRVVGLTRAGFARLDAELDGWLEDEGMAL